MTAPILYLRRIFAHTGDDFSALEAADRWLDAHGFLRGSLQADAPTGVHRVSEAAYISKWRGLSDAERAELDGRLEAVNPSLRYRNGDVVLFLRTSVAEALGLRANFDDAP